MTSDAISSIALLGCFIWAVRFLLPKAVREQDGMALTCAVLTAALALLAWLLIGVSARSKGSDGTALRPLTQCHPLQFGGVPRVGVEVLDQG